MNNITKDINMEKRDGPLVTNGFPVDNWGKFIIDALKSIRDQTYTNFQCHTVNNVSTDKTRFYANH